MAGVGGVGWRVRVTHTLCFSIVIVQFPVSCYDFFSHVFINLVLLVDRA